jgi:hypothetical protein
VKTRIVKTTKITKEVYFTRTEIENILKEISGADDFAEVEFDGYRDDVGGATVISTSTTEEVIEAEDGPE